MNDFCSRFHFAQDMNGDFLFTVSDVWLIAKLIFLLPSNLIVYLIEHSKFATFFEVDCSTGTSLGGVLVSFVFWFFGWAIFVSLLEDGKKQ